MLNPPGNSDCEIFDEESCSPEMGTSFLYPTSNVKLFIGNLPPNTKKRDIISHVLQHVGDVEASFIISASAITTRKYGKPRCYGSVTVSSSAEIVIPKLNGSLMKGCKLRVKLYKDSRNMKVNVTVRSNLCSGRYFLP